METKLYGVSYGNGNAGVSHMFADFYVCTNDPWRLATLATLEQFKPKAMPWALEHVDVDGENEFTIYATILAAWREGWNLFDADHGTAIQLVDDPSAWDCWREGDYETPKFTSDAAAIAFVRARAAEGALHAICALKMHTARDD